MACWDRAARKEAGAFMCLNPGSGLPSTDMKDGFNTTTSCNAPSAGLTRKHNSLPVVCVCVCMSAPQLHTTRPVQAQRVLNVVKKEVDRWKHSGMDSELKHKQVRWVLQSA